MIIDNVKSLKIRKYEDGFNIYVRRQNSEAICEIRNTTKKLIHEIRENNRNVPKDKQIKSKIIRNQFYIDDEMLTYPVIIYKHEDFFFNPRIAKEVR